MSSIEQLKSEAAALEAKARAQGHPMKHCDALEQVARSHGYDSWRACRAILAATAPAISAPLPEKLQINDIEMKRYNSREWHFELNIPKRWNSFPAVPTNSPNEVIRFASHEDGNHLLIVFRNPYDPQQSPEAYSGQIQQYLEKAEFSNFVTGETTIGSRRVLTLDFDKSIPPGGTWIPEGGTWSCRHYFIIDGTLAYTLGFGTSKWTAMIDLYDRMAKSFVSEEPPG
jgi:Glyoxalase superfamily protein